MNRGRNKTLITFMFSAFMLLVLVACGSAAGTEGPEGPPVGNCAHSLTGNVTSPLVLSPAGGECDYALSGSLRVTSSLTIQPGTRIVAAQGSIINIDDGGSLLASGSADQRIALVGSLPERGTWFGICFRNGHRESTLDYVDVEWAGGVFNLQLRDQCRAAIGSSGGSGGPVHIANSTIVGSSTSGVDATRLVLGNFSGNVLEGHAEYGLRTAPANVGRLDAASVYGGADNTLADGSSARNGRPYVFIESAAMDNTGEDQVWQPLDVPYYLNATEPVYTGSVLTLGSGTTTVILAGTRIVMGSESYIRVGDDAVLVLAGVPGNEVVFTGEEQVAGA